MVWNKRTNEEFLEIVKNLVGDEYTPLDDYENAHIKIRIKHNECGGVYKVKPFHFINKGNRCKYCFGTNQKTHEQFMEEVLPIIKEEFTVLGKYINQKTKIKVKHNICGFINDTVPKSIKDKRCPKCAGMLKKTTEQYKKEVYDLVGDEFMVSGKYKNNNTKIVMLHTKCGKYFEATPTDFLHGGNRCSHCFKNKQKTHKEFVKQVHDLFGDEYTVLGKYEKALKKVKMKHNKCGHIWMCQPASFLFSNRCPKCRFSKGESAILNWLIKNNVENIQQYKIKDCKNKLPLPFDFAVFKNDGSFVLIEFQGEQHDRAYEVWGGKKRLEYRQNNDKIKKNYCEKNNIPLLLISYKDIKKIDEILEKELLKLDLKKAFKKEEQLTLLF